jgi:uncharacterized protein YcbX
MGLSGLYFGSIFVEGCEAFAEDKWGTFKIGDLQFHGVKLRARCTVSHYRIQSAVLIYCR